MVEKIDKKSTLYFQFAKDYDGDQSLTFTINTYDIGGKIAHEQEFAIDIKGSVATLSLFGEVVTPENLRRLADTLESYLKEVS